MAVESSTKINLAKLGEFRIAGASEGVPCDTTAAFTQLPPKTERVIMTPRNFSTAVVVKIALNPWLVVLKTGDTMATEPIDYSEYAQDNSTSTSVDISSLNTRANGDFLLVGSHVPYRGVYFDIDGTNTTASVTLSVYYWNGAAWTDTSATVSGVTGSTAFDQDGLVYWTVPSQWVSASIGRLYEACPSLPKSANISLNRKLYWTRWEVDTAITDTSVTFDSMTAANRSTSYAEIVSGQMVSADIYHGVGGIGNIESLTDAGTANLVVNAITKEQFA